MKIPKYEHKDMKQAIRINEINSREEVGIFETLQPKTKKPMYLEHVWAEMIMVSEVVR